jgi:hypothetical protein
MGTSIGQWIVESQGDVAPRTRYLNKCAYCLTPGIPIADRLKDPLPLPRDFNNGKIYEAKGDISQRPTEPYLRVGYC